MSNTTFDSGKKMDILGVDGTLTHRTIKPGKSPELWFKQRWVSEKRPMPKSAGYRIGAYIQVEIRFDDELGNGHNTFAITATINEPQNKRDCAACGCLHDDIVTVFPELSSLIRWHCTSSDGPMHGVENALYHASDRDYNGRAKGEPSSFDYGIRFANFPITYRLKKSFNDFLQSSSDTGDFQVTAIAHADKPGDTHKFKPRYTLVGYAEKWYECPFDDEQESHEFCQAINTCKHEFVTIPTAFSEGKERDLQAARDCAVWPDATDEQLMLPKAELKKLLEDRLPALIADFRHDMEACGLLWEPKDYKGE